MLSAAVNKPTGVFTYLRGIAPFPQTGIYPLALAEFSEIPVITEKERIAVQGIANGLNPV